MKIVWVIGGALFGGIVAAAATCGVLLLHQNPTELTADQLIHLVQLHAALIGAIFVTAFAILSLIIFTISANTNLRVSAGDYHRCRCSIMNGFRNSFYLMFAEASLEVIARKLEDAVNDFRSHRATQKSQYRSFCRGQFALRYYASILNASPWFSW